MLKLMGTKYLSSRSTFMKKILIIISVCWLWACGGGGESSPTEPQVPVNQDTLVSAFLDLIMHYQVYCVRNQEVN